MEKIGEEHVGKEAVLLIGFSSGAKGTIQRNDKPYGLDYCHISELGIKNGVLKTEDVRFI